VLASLLLNTGPMQGSSSWAALNSSDEYLQSSELSGDTNATALISSARIIPHCLHGILDMASALL